MKNSLITVALLLAFTITTLTACNKEECPSPVAVSIVIGNHANSKEPNLASPEIEKEILEATSSYGFVSIVTLDGSPELAGGCRINPPQADLAKSKLKQIATNQAHSILSNLSAIKASHPEVDTLAALEVARRSLTSAPQGSFKHIVILDSGLSTAGLINFQESGFIDANPNIVAGYLSDRNAIPDFSDIKIIWLGLGDIAAPQDELSSTQRNNLKQIWTAIIEKTGGRVTFLDTLSGGDNPANDYPKVSTVSLPGTSTVTFDITKPIVFRENQIGFIGDTAEYINPAKTKEILTPVAEYMKQNPNFTALLVGSTAGEKDKHFCLQLSAARASMVQNTLVSLGTPANRIKATGMGFDDPWHIPDIGADGKLIESAAARNRKVTLLDVSSAEAQRILAGNR